ncbi:MAG: hypothetical protein JO257_28835 [Deltaproteobacteria bacterium]|nr:hypothetical protein [Deltaproteobacteria bacterium]
MKRLAFVFLFAACGAHSNGSTTGTAADAPAADADLGCFSNPCAHGMYCTTGGTCAPGCGSDADCSTGQACCGNTCKPLDTLSDCGSCGNSCGSGEFCTGTACEAPTYPNFCDNKTVYVIHDGITADNHAADVMASTIAANCPPDVMIHTADQTDPTLVDQTTGQPLGGGGVTYVLGGGPFPNKPLKWLERTNDITKIYFDAPDGVNFYWRDRTGTSVAQMPGAQCSVHRDQFITELVTDPMSGTLSLIGYGACSGGHGTLAAAWYYANVILPNRMTYPDSWYVYDWTDTDNDGAPSAGDTFTALAHGI